MRLPKFPALLLLGFASGLPNYLTANGKTLQAWMTLEQVDLKMIGLFGLVGLPYTLKFLWAPLFDRIAPPVLGRRRGWLLILQGALVLAIAAMATQDPQEGLYLLALNALVLAFFSASQDVVGDAYRADVLEKNELGQGAAFWVLGYRLALITTGSLALILADPQNPWGWYLTWPQIYGLMAVLMAGALGITALAPVPPEAPLPSTWDEVIRQPFIEFFQRQGVRTGLGIMAFIVVYKLGDALVLNMSVPFLKHQGYSLTDIGAIQSGLGLLASIGGLLAGGWILRQISISQGLWAFGILQAVSNLGYGLLSIAPKSYPLLLGAVLIENLAAGLVTAVLVGYLMSLCNPRFSATQYALLSSLLAVGSNLVAASAGWLAEFLGWPLFFAFTMAAALPGLLLLSWAFPPTSNLHQD